MAAQVGQVGIRQILKWEIPPLTGSIKTLKIVCVNEDGTLAIVVADLQKMTAERFAIPVTDMMPPKPTPI